MLDLNDLYYFAMAVDHGGFAPAARALGVPKSKLSRRIALLEERLGLRLIQRSTRQFSTTDAGQRFHAHCKAMLVEAEAAQDSIDAMRAEPRGLVRMSCPIALLHADVGPMLSAFLAQCPRVTVQLQATNRAVDVIGEGFDLSLRVRTPPLKDSDLVLKVLAQREQCLVASPSFLQRYPIAVPADLGYAPTLDNGPVRHDYRFELTDGSGASASVRVQPRLITDDMRTLRDAAIAGVGLVQLPRMLASEALARGELETVLPDWRLPVHVVHAVLPSTRHLLPAVRALLDFLAERFRIANER